MHFHLSELSHHHQQSNRQTLKTLKASSFGAACSFLTNAAKTEDKTCVCVLLSFKNRYSIGNERASGFLVDLLQCTASSQTRLRKIDIQLFGRHGINMVGHPLVEYESRSHYDIMS